MSATDDLFSALRQGNYDAAQSALEAGADPNGSTLAMRDANMFHFFLCSGFIEQARWLHARGANIQSVDALGDTVLMRLIERNRPHEFAVAMEMGVDVDKPNLRGVTPVLRSALFKHGKPYLEQLLAAGAQPSVVAQSRTTPLLAAVSEGFMDMARMLFDAGSDPRGLDENGQNIIYAAVLSGKPAMLQLVLERTQEYRKTGEIDVNHSAGNHSQPLGKAASFSPEMVLMLLREGASPNAQSKNKLEPGMTALHLLAAVDEDGEATLVNEALALGASPTLRDNAGNNAAVYATINGLDGKRAVLQALIDAGLDPKAPTGPQAVSPIHHAILSYQQPLDDDGQPVGPSRVDVAAALIDMGFPTLPMAWSDPNQPSEVEPLPPPLVLALARKDLEMGRVLIEKGTGLNVLDDRGLSVLHRMAPVTGLSREEATAASLTRQSLGRFNKSLEDHLAPEAAPGSGTGKAAPSKSKKGPAPSEKARARAAEVAAQLEAMESQARDLVATVANWLTDNGADWNLRGRGGKTPAMAMARQDGHWMIGQAARFHGADLSLRDEMGWTAADHALHTRSYPTLLAIVGHLERAGKLADVDGLLVNAVLSSPEASHDQEGSFQRRAAFTQVLSVLPADPVLLEGRDEEGNTPLILAAATGQDDLVRLLLAMGADPNAQNNAGETALLHAVHAGESDIVRLVRAAGADVELASAAGVRPRDLMATNDSRMSGALSDPDPADKPELELPAQMREQAERAKGVWVALSRDPAPEFDPLARRRFAM